jgi:hypothetical protein
MVVTGGNTSRPVKEDIMKVAVIYTCRKTKYREARR